MEAMGTQDMEFIEYVGVIGVIALLEVDMLVTSGYNFCASIFRTFALSTIAPKKVFSRENRTLTGSLRALVIRNNQFDLNLSSEVLFHCLHHERFHKQVNKLVVPADV